MNLKSGLLAALMLALPALAQTAAEQLQKGIFAQESQGKIDDAISIYRQLANSTLTPREVAAQAQYRLSQSLLQKGDIATATREMERLERDFSEYKNLISSLAAGMRAPAPPPPPEVQYNLSSRITVHGKVKQVMWINPTSWLHLDSNGREYHIQLASPNGMLRTGARRDTYRIGDELTVEGATALDGTPTLFAVTVAAADGRALFDREKVELAAAEAIEQQKADLAKALAEQQSKGK